MGEWDKEEYMNVVKNGWLMGIGLFLAILINPLTIAGLSANQSPHGQITLVSHGHHGGGHHSGGHHHGDGWGWDNWGWGGCDGHGHHHHGGHHH